MEMTMRFWTEKMHLLSFVLFISLFSPPTRAFLNPPTPTTNSNLGTDTSIHTREPPGTLRRRVFGDVKPPKFSLPLPLISAVVAALKEENPFEAIPVFLRVLSQEQSQNTALPIAYKPLSSLSFPTDCISAQQQTRSSPTQPFLMELTPGMLNIQQDDRQGQLEWLQENVSTLKEWKLSHGAVCFKEWDVFKDRKGVDHVSRILGTPCRDPKEIRGPAPLLDDSSTIYETLNNPNDAATHLGLHYEGIPGIIPTSALFSCFQPADSGGEFLLCDGRQVFRDLDTSTLANLQDRRLRPTFAALPKWISSPFIFGENETLRQYWWELLALFTDMTKPTDDFFLDVFPSDDNTVSLKLTTHASVPVIHHPITSQLVWFSGMDAGEQRNFQRDNPHLRNGNTNDEEGKYASEVFDVRYGNGSIISDEDLQSVRQACVQNTRELLMQPGDAVYLDNFAVLHGRKPFRGTRKHTVVWFLD